MHPIKTAFHPSITVADIQPDSPLICLTRHATRAIVLKGENILLLYTERYDDYSLPGGGLDKGEEQTAGLIRELQEETGAQNITNIGYFTRYDEYRPWHKDNADIMHMVSYCYTCTIDNKLGDTALESHEIRNGMTARWVNIHTAIKHNKDVIANSPKKGLSIERETFLLTLIAEKLINDAKK